MGEHRTEPARLDELARTARVAIVETIAQAGGGHLGGPLSAIDVLCALYFDVLDIDPQRPNDPHRDRFVLSKGHSSIALYTVLALRGYFPVEELRTFDAVDSRLQGHPDMTLTPGVDMSTGSLGLGFSAAVGVALGAKLAGEAFTTFVMLGDGECNEGIVWEGAHVASKHRLDNLVAVVDVNGLQQHGWQDGSGRRLPPYPHQQLADRWAAFGWHVLEVDGHDLAAVPDCLRRAQAHHGSPVAVLSSTVKGKGVSFMEDAPAWHSRVPDADELRRAVAELSGATA